ncbi:exotoxin A binding domain-containing protein, partial [Klebsiella quasipneumoniae]
RASQLDVASLLGEQAGSGVLHYSMVLEEGGDSLKLALGNALTLRTDGTTITLTSATAGKGPRTYSYTRQGRGNWSLHWLVPVGDDAPASIKVFFHELDAGSEVSHISPIYSIEVSDDLLRSMASNSTLFVRHVENNEINRNLTLSAAGVGFVAAPTQHSRQKRWSEWHTGKVLCLLDPLDAVY